MSDKEFPAIDELKEVIVRHNLSFAVAKSKKELPNPYVRIQVTLLLNQISLIIPAFDEYEDAKKEHPVLMFHLVLTECEDYEDATDFVDWAKTSGLNPSEPRVVRVWDELKEFVPKLREIIGSEIKSLSGFDFEMNMGVAYKLRNG